jgi:hypothetical protein
VQQDIHPLKPVLFLSCLCGSETNDDTDIERLARADESYEQAAE